MMQTETTGVWNSPHHLYTKMLKITNQENQPTPKISKANKYNAILFLGLVILLALATGFLFRNMAQPTKPDIVIRPHYQIQDKKNLSVWVEISSITISRTWNLISGNRPVVTIRGKVDCKDEKVKYGTFVFRPTDDPIWSDIDANKKKDGHYQAKIRDCRKGKTYECHFVAVTKKQKYISPSIRVTIPQ